MLKVLLNIIYCLLPVIIFTGNSNNLFSANDGATAFIESRREVDLCKTFSERPVVLYISIGDVKQSDSLFGFNFEITYNPEKILLHTPLRAGTLAELLDPNGQWTGIQPDNLEGRASGYSLSLNFTKPVSGNKALIGIAGDYIGDEEDTAFVNIDYIEFTDEFNKVISNFVPAIVEAKFIPKEQFYLNTNSSKEFIQIKHADSENVTVGLETNYLPLPEKINFSAKLNNINFEISNVIPLSENTELEYYENNKQDVIISLNKIDYTNADALFELKITKSDNEEFVESILELTPIVQVTGHCIKHFASSIIEIQGLEKEKDTTTSINVINYDKLKWFVNEHNYLQIQSDLVITNFRLYNILGNELIRLNDIHNTNVLVDFNNLPKSLYIGIIEFNNNTNMKIKILNNIIN